MPALPTSSDCLLLRPSAERDVAAIAAIYAWSVEHGSGTFELEAPSPEEVARRRNDVVGKRLPWLVAERGERVLGFAYANHFRPRPAYRFALEDSIYLAPDASGHGIGRLLLAELIARSEALGARQMFALVGGCDNLASIGVHRALGFTQVGVMRAAGWKFDRWLDVVILQRSLGLGDTAAPLDTATA